MTKKQKDSSVNIDISTEKDLDGSLTQKQAKSVRVQLESGLKDAKAVFANLLNTPPDKSKKK